MKSLFFPRFLALSVTAGAVCLLACSQTQRRDNSLLTDPTLARNDSIMRRFSPADAARKAAKIDTFFRIMHQRYGFNGSVLVAQYGQVIYKGAFGYSNLTTKDTLSSQTPFQLASVSKQFTAVAVMQLQEKGLLKYDDPVYRYFPGFPYDSSITVRMLLTHRSGLPNYIYTLEKYVDRSRPMSNREVVDKLFLYKPKAYGLPDQRFNYNNTNYALLAALVERLSGKSFREYADENLFRPLGMSNTFINDGTENRVVSAATGYTGSRRSLRLDYLDGVTGDKGVYSSVEDLFKWDRGLYTEKIIKQGTLQEAFMPAHRDANLISKNYGFGWRLQKLPDNQWLTFHTGWWHGFKNYFMRNLQDQTTIILLSNVANGYMSKVGVLQAILYPTRANYFLRRDVAPTEMAETPGGTVAPQQGEAEFDLTEFSKMAWAKPLVAVRKSPKHRSRHHVVKKSGRHKVVAKKRSSSQKKRRR
ncbi:MAG: beta-lactamase family protein [Cytophagaceae bacterium]|nr:beta-lactamase family protein [Cytophagaceae bacterium]